MLTREVLKTNVYKIKLTTRKGGKKRKKEMSKKEGKSEGQK